MSKPRGWTLALGAVGVVYSALGTNPLFALGECFDGAHALAPTPTNVLGVLSLVFWALVAVVSIKYLAVLMRTHNHGEGGILALFALVPRGGETRRRRALLLLVIFGAGLLYGDGVITPAISVLSAVEGVRLVLPAAHEAVVPLTVVILIALFLAQRRSTHRVDAWFGPVMVLWFVAIGAFGLVEIFHNPAVTAAVLPQHALRFLREGGWTAYFSLGAVVLCIAGAEALYAEMGQFGREPIARAWYWLVFPSLLANYFGQGAHLIAHGPPSGSTFYAIVPRPLLLPMVILATVATVVASQTLISGAYSLTEQAIRLGLSPRTTVVHTSAEQRGQVYVPRINWVLMLACVALVIGFGSSSRLAAAYGLAITGAMTITSLAYFVVARRTKHWPLWRALAVVGAFLLVDLAFLGANLPKLASGGTVPLAIGLVVFALMTSWWSGRRQLAHKLVDAAFPFEALAADLAAYPPHRVPGTGVFLTANPEGVPPVLFHHYKHNKVLHQQVVVLSIVTTRTPYVRGARWVEVHPYGEGLYRAIAHVGFMEPPDVPSLLAACSFAGLRVDLAGTSYFISRETLVVRDRRWFGRAWKGLFAVLLRNAQRVPAYFQLPANRVVELGMQLEL